MPEGEDYVGARVGGPVDECAGGVAGEEGGAGGEAGEEAAEGGLLERGKGGGRRGKRGRGGGGMQGRRSLQIRLEVGGDFPSRREGGTGEGEGVDESGEVG